MDIETLIIRASKKKCMAKIIKQISTVEKVISISYPNKELLSKDRIAFIITDLSVYQIGVNDKEQFFVSSVSATHSPSVLAIDESIINLVKIWKIGKNSPNNKRWIC